MDTMYSIISTLSFACHHYSDSFYFLSILEDFILHFVHVKDSLQTIRIVFNSIIQCFGNLQRSLVPVNQTIKFAGTYLFCNVSKYDQKINENLIDFSYNNANISFEFNINYTSLYRHPFDVVHCVLQNPPSLNLREAEFHMIGLSTLYNSSQSWFGQASFRPNFDTNSFEVRLWKNESWLSLDKDKAESFSFTFQDINSIIMVQAPVNSFKFESSPAEKSSRHFLVVCILGSAIIILVCVIAKLRELLKEKQAIRKSKMDSPSDEMESIVELKNKEIVIEE